MGKEIQLAQLEKDTEHPEFWSDSTNAQRVMKTVASLRNDVESWSSIKQHLHDLTELARMDDESLRGELDRILEHSKFWDRKVNSLQVTDAKEHSLELRVLVSAETDSAESPLREAAPVIRSRREAFFSR